MKPEFMYSPYHHLDILLVFSHGLTESRIEATHQRQNNIDTPFAYSDEYLTDVHFRTNFLDGIG